MAEILRRSTERGERHILEKIGPAEGLIEDFTLEEVRTAVKSLENGKAPGPTREADMVKLACDSAVKELLDIFQRILCTVECPQQWGSSLLEALYKCHPLLCSN